MPRVTHDGRETAYAVSAGDGGATLLCVHGSGGTAGVWKAQRGRLAAHDVAALDLSGHGDSPDCTATPGPDALAAYAADVTAVARAVDADVLVGNSLGGAVALTVALDPDPDVELSGLVLAGAGAKLAVLERLRGWLADDFDRAVEWLHGPDRLLHDPSDRLRELSRAAMRDAGQAVVRRDFLTCHAFDVRDRLDALGVPLLALTGEHDTLTPPAYHEYLAANAPDAAWTTLPDAAHLSMLETPGAFNDELRAFLDGIETE